MRCVLALAASLALAAPVAAEPVVRHIRVHVAGADAATLQARLEEGARRACGISPRFDPNYDLIPSAVSADFERCRKDALARAQAELSGARHASATPASGR